MPTDYKKIYQITKNGQIIDLTFFKDVPVKEANIKLSQKVSEELVDIFDKNKDKDLCLVIDTSVFDKNIKMPRESREEYAKMVRHKHLKKVAIITKSVYVRVIAKSIIFITGRKKNVYEIFDNKKDALEWVKRC